MKSRRLRICTVVFFAAVFVFLIVFFTQVHPLMIYDSDDWTYISKSREPFPSLNEYNPGKVFPETFQGLMSYFAVFCIYPFTRDYIGSISGVYAVVFCLFVLLYLWEFYRLICWIKPEMHQSFACILTALFLLFHFSIFKVAPSNNSHLLLSGDLNCYYNYTVPDLMNATLVLYLIRNEFRIKPQWFYMSVLIAFGYFSIFSNVFMTGILMSAVGIDLIIQLMKIIRKQITVPAVLKERWYSFVLLFFWIIEIYFESHGSRAKAVGQSFDLYDSFKTYASWRRRLNKSTMAVLLIGIAVAVVIYIVHRKRKSERSSCKIFVLLLASFILDSVFLIVVCAKTGQWYISRDEVIFGVAFYGFLIGFTCLSYVVSKYPQTMTVLILSGLIIFLNVNNGRHIFNEPCGAVKPSQAKLVDEDILNQVVTAYKQGKTDMVLHVPKGDDNDNWPHANYMGGRVNETLNRHGIINRDMNITVKPDLAMNKKYNLGY